MRYLPYRLVSLCFAASAMRRHQLRGQHRRLHDRGRIVYLPRPVDDLLFGHFGERPDLILGTASAECILGGAGNDVIVGNGGTDALFGDDGDDSVSHRLPTAPPERCSDRNA